MINLEFVQVPASALNELDGAILKIFSIIYTCCKLNNNKFYHSYQQFADECNISERWAKKAVCFLKKNGYIEFESGKGSKSPNTYHLLNSELQFTNNTNNSEVEFTINGELQFPQKEKRKEGININNNMNNNNNKEEIKEEGNGKHTTKCEVNKTFLSFDSVDGVERMSEGECETQSMNITPNRNGIVKVGDISYVVSNNNYDYIFNSMPQIAQHNIQNENLEYADAAQYPKTGTIEYRENPKTTPTSAQSNPTEQLSNGSETNAPDPLKTPNTVIDELEAQFNYIPPVTAAETINLPKRITKDMVRGIDCTNLKAFEYNSALLTEAANTPICFIEAMNKADELVTTWRRPFIPVCDVYWNAKELMEDITLTDKAKDYATDTLQRLKASIHRVGGDEMLKIRK